jgi:hypothetical protein
MPDTSNRMRLAVSSNICAASSTPPTEREASERPVIQALLDAVRKCTLNALGNLDRDARCIYFLSSGQTKTAPPRGWKQRRGRWTAGAAWRRATTAANLRPPTALVHYQRQHTAVTVMMGEKRSSTRHRVLKAGKIEIGGGAADCTVRNLSNTGAALNVESPVDIPDTFVLLIPSDQLRRACRVIWRKMGRIGVKFE